MDTGESSNHLLTLCAVAEWPSAGGAPACWQLVYGHLQEVPARLSGSVQRNIYLTASPVTLGKSAFRLAVTRSALTGDEVTLMLNSLPKLQNPACPGTQILAPGAWDCEELLAADRSAPVHAFLPGLAKERCMRIREWAPSANALLDFLGRDQVLLAAAAREVRDVLAIDLHANPDYFGALVVSRPVPECAINWNRIGAGGWAFETLGPLFEQQNARVTVTGFSDDRITSSISQALGTGSWVCRFPPGTDRLEAFVHDNVTGQLLYHSAPTFLTKIAIDMGVTDQELDLTLTLPGITRPVLVRTAHGKRETTTVGNTKLPNPALARRRRARLGRRLLEMSDRNEFRLLGPEDGKFGEEFRRQQERAIQALFNSQIKGYVKIWDPYFGIAEVATYLLAVYDPDTPMKILTGKRSPRQSPLQNSELAEKIAPNLDDATMAELFAKLKVQAPNLRLPDKNLEVRAASSVRHHDRFVITDDRCWLFGTSLNSIGDNYSTMVELPNKGAVEALFDLEWERAAKLVEGAA